MDSLKSNVEKLKPAVIMIQETKLYRKGSIKLENYDTFELLRNPNEGGRLAISTHHSLEAVLVSEGTAEAEILTVEATIGNLKVRMITGYGPQEREPASKREEFFDKIDEECQSAKMANAGIIIEMDANAKLGEDFIKDDKHKLGKLLLKTVERNDLTIVNTTEPCEGVITRQKKTEKLNEESTIDYILVCQKMLQFITKMKIDENRAYVLTKFATKKR